MKIVSPFIQSRRALILVHLMMNRGDARWDFLTRHAGKEIYNISGIGEPLLYCPKKHWPAWPCGQDMHIMPYMSFVSSARMRTAPDAMDLV